MHLLPLDSLSAAVLVTNKSVLMEAHWDANKLFFGMTLNGAYFLLESFMWHDICLRLILKQLWASLLFEVSLQFKYEVFSLLLLEC